MKVSTGPPVTFANPTNTNPASAPVEESKDANAVDAMNDVNFDVVQSPMTRRHTMTSAAKKEPQVPMVPQEQYDALKAKFIENETATEKRLQSINDLEKTIARREQQLEDMERTFNKRLEEAKAELESFKQQARENERDIQLEVRTAKEEKAKAIATSEEEIQQANQELTEVRENRDSLIQEKNDLVQIHDVQKNAIDRLE